MESQRSREISCLLLPCIYNKVEFKQACVMNFAEDISLHFCTDVSDDIVNRGTVIWLLPTQTYQIPPCFWPLFADLQRLAWFLGKSSDYTGEGLSFRKVSYLDGIL
jgi:hypothetical protein